MMRRRDFMRSATALGILPLLGMHRPPQPPRRGPLRILILGGTGFIGPHQVRYAVERGHERVFAMDGIVHGPGGSVADIPEDELMKGFGE